MYLNKFTGAVGTVVQYSAQVQWSCVGLFRHMGFGVRHKRKDRARGTRDSMLWLVVVYWAWVKYGKMFRSQEMTRVRVYMERSCARETMFELAAMGEFEPRDLNDQLSLFQREYAADVRRCDEVLRKIRFVEGHLTEIVQPLDKNGQIAHAAFSAVPQEASDIRTSRDTAAISLDMVEKQFSEWESALISLNANDLALKQSMGRVVEFRTVLETVLDLFLQESRNAVAYEARRHVREAQPRGKLRATVANMLDPLMHPEPVLEAHESLQKGASVETFAPAFRLQGGGSLVSFVAGMVEADKRLAFERILFRTSRGNILTRFAPQLSELVDPSTGMPVQKVGFVVFCAGTQVKEKVYRICKSMGATAYNVPDDSDGQREALAKCAADIQDMEQVLERSGSQRQDLLLEVAACVSSWKHKVCAEKAVFHAMNFLNSDTSGVMYILEGWCPTRALDAVQTALVAGKKAANAQVSSVLEECGRGHESPPTYFVLNKFTSVFHSIVESYGVAEYQEVNPAPFLVITFPFLFAVMFGDIGHGVIMALFALFLIVWERRLLSRGAENLGEMLGTVFNGRYIIFLMGLFSIFTGFIYNELFAAPLDLFGTRWQYTGASDMACGIDNCANPAAVLPPLDPYPFGFDPVWKASQTGLLFFNSYKMKLSIVFGVSQMMLGLFLSAENARFFRRPLDFFFEFVPQVIFLCSIFGYLVVLIFLKWSIDWNAPGAMPAPDLKAILISMIMSPGNLSPDLVMFRGQGFVQNVLLLLALISVPWMLLPKPLILRSQHSKTRGYSALSVSSQQDDASSMAHDRDVEDNAEKGTPHDVADKGDQQPDAHDADVHVADHDVFDFGEVMVHQMIHTIEFVLGAISNTASYLRLWALSLAHSELSDVFLEKLLLASWETGKVLLIIIGCIMWLGATIGVLMLMESLSAFLHALRLHWVEFQNKFYNLHGNGRKFVPLVLDTPENELQ
ncbi:V-type proton ATPase subunit a2 [Porphyridium purpureum]|uniref:V-type proton ATPase subunit a n=1 Tax=Porphyridium purpureum TaxID=35688 RepID=A0A5J4YYU2_PORPP|nr:V-type proton ATPase subunit a2 [Porphyridium purpureum]|eukprot:POR4059..scf209_3